MCPNRHEEVGSIPTRGVFWLSRETTIKPKEESEMSTQKEVRVRIQDVLEPEPESCPHGYPEGRGCQECEFWERVDYE